MATLNDFRRGIRLTADNLPKKVNKLVRKVAIVIDQALVTSTPVDTGRARSNWIVGINAAPSEDDREPFFPGEQGSTVAQNTQASIDEATQRINTYAGSEGGSIYIVNSVPYIEELNNGTSKQAPANFVEEAVQKAVEAIKRADDIV